jgi:hypothetical protein
MSVSKNPVRKKPRVDDALLGTDSPGSTCSQGSYTSSIYASDSSSSQLGQSEEPGSELLLFWFFRR